MRHSAATAVSHSFVYKAFGTLCLLFALGFITPAQAADCGGKNQKACPAIKKGPQCGPWLHKDKKKICRPCGGKNQRACPAVKKGPQCKAWLSKDKRKICRPCGHRNGKACPAVKKGPRCQKGLKPSKGICVTKPQKASKNMLKQVDALIKKNTTHIKALGQVRSCMRKDGRKKALKRAYKRRDSAAAQRIVNACVTPSIKSKLSGKPRGLGGNNASRGPYFKTLSIGAGAGFIIGGGVSGDAGVVISLNSPGVRFYTNREFSYGAGLSVGADVIVGLSRQQLQTGEDKGRAIAAAGKYLAGGGVSVDFSGHKFPKFSNFDGFSVSGGAGAGAEVGTIYKSTAKVF